MPPDGRAPVIVGAGQHLHRATGLDDAVEPVELMAHAIRAAADDAGLTAVPAPDSLRVVSLFSWRYGNPGWVLARRLGLEPRELAYTTAGGNSPQTLLNATAGAIGRGELDVAILTGGEAWRTRMRARRAGVDVDWEQAPDVAPPVVLGLELDMSHPAEIAHGVQLPVQVYPMFESALRAEAGRSVDDHQRHLGELWAGFSRVAARNPFAWIDEEKSADEIRTVTQSNRMIGLPYPKYMNSNNDVDMAAALIVCSVDAARRLGVAPDRWVFPHSGTDCHEHPYVSQRSSFTRLPAVELGGRRAMELAGVDIDDISIVDLYSCFPAAVQLGASSLGLGLDRKLTRTGGLSFAGGPWNNYVMHAIATIVGELRDHSGERALVWANGGYVTKHAFGVYSTTPPDTGFRHETPQAQIDAMPRCELADGDDAAGPATIEAYTVMHDRDGTPERAITTCRLGDGRRAWGLSTDADLCTAMTDGEWVGRPVTLGAAASLIAT